MGVRRNKHHDDEVRRVAVELLETGASIARLVRVLGISRRTASRWRMSFRVFGKDAVMGNDAYRRYDYQTRLGVARDHVDHGLSTAEVMAKYGVVSTTLVQNWCRLYRLGGADTLRAKPCGSRAHRKELSASGETVTKGERVVSQPVASVAQLVDEVEFLRARVAYLEKVRALQVSKLRAENERVSCVNLQGKDMS